MELCAPLQSGFFRNASKNAAAPALEFAGAAYSYGHISDLALRVSYSVKDFAARLDVPTTWVGVLCGKTPQGYATLLGILNAGYGYMPILPDTPIDRMLDYLRRAECRVLVVDSMGMKVVYKLLERLSSRLLVIITEDMTLHDVEEIRGRFPQHSFMTLQSERDSPKSDPLAASEKAYLMFTSGSTGRPKGVMISHGNVRHYLNVVSAEYDFSSDDRFSQFFDFTFDLSVFDIFVAFEFGATLCPLTETDKLFGAKYIERLRITVWFSVPSFISYMTKTKQLWEGRFRGLRYSLFCGEGLIQKDALEWSRAAQLSVVENLYGPTELTISCARYVLPKSNGEIDLATVVPLGQIHDGLQWTIIRDPESPLGEGAIGELAVAGPQVALGYLDDPDEQNARFVKLGSTDVVYYRTGDIVREDKSQLGWLHFIGRNDQQIKVGGYRIEIGEIEAALRRIVPDHRVIVVPIGEHKGHTQIIACVESASEPHPSIMQLRERLQEVLPSYMIPKSINVLPAFPENANRKIDRKSLIRAFLEANNSEY